MKFTELIEVIDTGAVAPTNSTHIPIMSTISFYMRLTELTGTIDACVAILQCSPDGVIWDDVADTFIPVRIREDRDEPNAATVACSVWDDIRNPVVSSTLLGDDMVLMRRLTNKYKQTLLSQYFDEGATTKSTIASTENLIIQGK